MSTITIRRIRAAASQQAPGMAGAFGASMPGESITEEVECLFEAGEVEVTLSEIFTRTFGVEPSIVEFIDEPSQTETDSVRLGDEETLVDGKSAEELGLQNGAAYYVTSIDGDKRLMLYGREAFEDRDDLWVPIGIKSFRLAAPAVSN